MLKTKVILSSVTNLSDARYASGMGVDYIGFAINPDNERYVTAESAQMIKGWLSGVRIIGEIDSFPVNNMAAYPLDFVQTNNPALVDDFDNPVLFQDVDTLKIEQLATTLETTAGKVNFFILRVPAGQLSSFHQQLSDICSRFPVFIATDFNSASLQNVLDKLKPKGIVLYGSIEEKPGFSSYDGIADILEQLEED
jgi:phosphoribosylanthranilate isomerase